MSRTRRVFGKDFKVKVVFRSIKREKNIGGFS
jgi:hypothetical protein